PLITAVTLAEFSARPLVASTDTELAARLAHLQQAEADSIPCISMSKPPRLWSCGRIASASRAQNQRPSLRSHDRRYLWPRAFASTTVTRADFLGHRSLGGCACPVFDLG